MASPGSQWKQHGSWQRLLAGFMLAPLAPGLLQSIITGSIGPVLQVSQFAYIFALVLGLPAFLLARKLRIHPSAAMTIGVGCLLSIPSALAYTYMGDGEFAWFMLLPVILLLTYYCGCIALAFWYIALKPYGAAAR